MSDRELKPDDTTDHRDVGGCLSAESHGEPASKQEFTLRPDETTFAGIILKRNFESRVEPGLNEATGNYEIVSHLRFAPQDFGLVAIPEPWGCYLYE